MIEEKEEPGPGAGGAPANDPGEGPAVELPDEGVAASPDEQLAALETELAETKDRLLRALAEAENTRRRFQREREETQKYAIGGFAKDLLTAVDNLRRALAAVPEADVKDQMTRGLLDGVAATERELLAAFERHGLKRVDPAGEKFDHNVHQAIFEIERDGVAPGTVVEVLQPGWLLHDRLLRPAMVGVAKAGGAAKPDEANADA